MKTVIVGVGTFVLGSVIGLAGGAASVSSAPVSAQSLAPPVTVTAPPEILTQTPGQTTVVQTSQVAPKTRVAPVPVFVAGQEKVTTKTATATSTATRTTTAKPTAVAKAQVSYASCAEVRAAGKAPIKKGQPGYSTKLDRDKDGTACEQ